LCRTASVRLQGSGGEERDGPAKRAKSLAPPAASPPAASPPAREEPAAPAFGARFGGVAPVVAPGPPSCCRRRRGLAISGDLGCLFLDRLAACAVAAFAAADDTRRARRRHRRPRRRRARALHTCPAVNRRRAPLARAFGGDAAAADRRNHHTTAVDVRPL